MAPRTRAFSWARSTKDSGWPNVWRTTVYDGNTHGMFVQKSTNTPQQLDFDNPKFWMGPDENFDTRLPFVHRGVEAAFIIAGVVNTSDYPAEGEVNTIYNGEVHFWRYSGEGPGLTVGFWDFAKKCLVTQYQINKRNWTWLSDPSSLTRSANPTIYDWQQLMIRMRDYCMWTNHPYWRHYSGDTNDYRLDTSIRNQIYTGSSALWNSPPDGNITDIISPPA